MLIDLSKIDLPLPYIPASSQQGYGDGDESE